MGAGRRFALRWVGAMGAVVLAGCSGGDGRGAVGPSTTRRPVGVNEATGGDPGARLRGGSDDLRIEVSRDRPLFLHNVYLSAAAAADEQVAAVRRIWPDDLEPYLAVQFVLPAQPPAPTTETEPWLEAALAATDDAGLPAFVQAAAMGTRTAPGDAVMARLFDRHPSFAGVVAAEFSAPFEVATTGLRPADVDLLVELIGLAETHRAYFLWQDMGYFGPQVFVDAGSDQRLADAIRGHADGVILQAKRNGSAKRFVTDAAAFGWWLSGQVGNWGVNSEDWLWWEAGYERRFAPQVVGSLGVAGYPRSATPNKARLSYPESLFGIEALVAAASGAAVFSLESPTRGYGDLGTGRASVAATEVVFPTLRAIVRRHLIESREALAAATTSAMVIDGRNAPELDFDAVFRSLYGPAECGDDVQSCDRGQWVPKTHRFGIVPILPATSPAVVRAKFEVRSPAEMIPPPLDRLAQEPGVETPSEAWGARIGDAWVLLNPWENRQHVVLRRVEVPLGDRTVDVSVELPAHAFVIVSADGDGLSVEVNDYRSAETWWDPAVGDADAEAQYLAGATPDAPERVLVQVFGRGVTMRRDGRTVEAARFEEDLRGRVVLDVTMS